MQNRILGAVPGIAGAIEIYKYMGMWALKSLLFCSSEIRRAGFFWHRLVVISISLWTKTR